jgi:hypothetical protein
VFTRWIVANFAGAADNRGLGMALACGRCLCDGFGTRWR